jgi:glycosyl transferase family 2
MNEQKQMLDVLEELDFASREPVLVKCLAVHNEEDWVEANINNCYAEFDVIRIVEGAVLGRPNSTDDGHSTDRTLEIIRNHPDPANKIELITQDRFFKSLEEQKQTFLDLANEGEWLFIVDCDEFYMDGDVEKVRQAIKARPNASEFIPTFLHFYRDFHHIKAPHPEWQMQHQRIIRYRDGLRYHTHPVATDAQGRCTYFDGSYQRKRFTLPNIYIYHYGHAKGKEFHEMKKRFYESELEKFKLADGTNASDKFDEKFVEFMEYKEDLSTILHYDGPHPTALDLHPHRHTCDDKSAYYDEYRVVNGVQQYTFATDRVKNWKDNFVYGADRLPTIALLMMGPWKKVEPFYNEVEV